MHDTNGNASDRDADTTSKATAVAASDNAPDDDCNPSSDGPASQPTPTDPEAATTSLTPRPPITTKPSETFRCRICRESDENEGLFAPCGCRGTLAHVHPSCLHRWLNVMSRNYCEICKMPLNTIVKKQYSFRRALSVWFRHPPHRTILLLKMMQLSLTTLLVLGLLDLIISDGEMIEENWAGYGISKWWITKVIRILIGLTIANYVMIVHLFTKGELIPWYLWWQHCVNVELVLDEKTAQLEVKR